MPSHLLSLAMGSKSSGSFRDNLGEEDNFQENGKAPSDLAKLLCRRVGDSLEWGRNSLGCLMIEGSPCVSRVHVSPGHHK